jgi:lipopolysaccharide/colanic/teichoic acid biosynthesis glycosyltransferase
MYALKLGKDTESVSIEERILLEKHSPGKKISGPVCDLFFHELKDKSPRARRVLDIIAALPASLLYFLTFPLIYTLLYGSGTKNPLRKFKITGIYGKELSITTYNTNTFQCLVMERDKRTHIQRFLHKTGLYKLPLFPVILSGELSLVGPQPMDSECAMIYANYYTHFYKRFSAKPGVYVPGNYYLTSGYSNEQRETSIQKDFSYVKNQTITAAFKVLIKAN